MARVGYTIAGAAKAASLPEKIIVWAVKNDGLRARRIDDRAIILHTDMQEWLDRQPTY